MRLTEQKFHRIFYFITFLLGAVINHLIFPAFRGINDSSRCAKSLMDWPNKRIDKNIVKTANKEKKNSISLKKYII